ncbi:hypothetical protein C8R46DRAFT_1083179 [Mycena filopes]|nr:hypothetical protein C8R46DRAFT_1083179 [Mycena filopes]
MEQQDSSTGPPPRPIASFAGTVRWLWTVLRKFRLNAAQFLGRRLLLILSAVSRIAQHRLSTRKDFPGPAQSDQLPTSNGAFATDTSSGHGGEYRLAISGNNERLDSASLIPLFHEHPLRHSNPRASQSTPDFSAPGVVRESDPNYRWSDHDLPTSLDYLPTPESIQPPHVNDYGPKTGSGTPLLSKAHPHLSPGTPESVQRYDREAFVPDEPSRWTIPPLSISLGPAPAPPGWTVCVHPEGALYFFNEKERVFTDAYLLDNETFKFIDANARLLKDFLLTHDIQLPFGADLVLEERVRADKHRECLYYFADHRGRTVFWLDEAASDIFSIAADVNGMSSPSHIQLELEAQYWYHCELFPRAWEVTHEIIEELRDMVLYALGDVITSTTSIVTWKLEELDRILHLTDGLTKTIGNTRFSGSSCRNVGRFMYRFVRQRVYDFYGQRGARLDIDQWVYNTTPKRTVLFELLNFTLFSAPNWNLLGLRMLYTHGLVPPSTWATFIGQLESEWQEFTLYGTVVLTANVAFLAIQSVDAESATGSNRSPTQILSYLSILTSIGGIIIRMLLLITQHGNWQSKWGPHTFAFLIRQHRLEALAIAYALPYGMLLWSMLWFLAAFSALCFGNSSAITRAVVAVLWALVAILVLWCNYGNTRGFRWLNIKLARRARRK